MPFLAQVAAPTVFTFMICKYCKGKWKGDLREDNKVVSCGICRATLGIVQVTREAPLPAESEQAILKTLRSTQQHSEE